MVIILVIIMKSYIKDFVSRPLYVERVKPFIGKNLVKVFTGQRRVGKSYLLFQLMDEIKKQDSKAKILYINKEDLAFAHLREAKDLNEYVLTHRSPKGKTYVFIDEIQDIADFELALRSLLLDDGLDLYCTGSNANLLSGDLAGNLSGRSIEITVYSLSYKEFLIFHELKDDDEALALYLKYGGLPYLRNLSLTDEIAFEYLKNIYSTIIFRDVVNRYSLRNTNFLEQLVLFIASNIGSLFSAKRISDFLKSQKTNIAPNQVQVYLQHLSNAFLIHPVKRYDLVGKRIFEIGEKYYFENLGIRNALWGYRIEDLGKILENVLYNHLLLSGFRVEVGVWGEYEIDFVAQKNGERIYIQAALTLMEDKTIERKFVNLQKIKDNYPKIVVTMDTFHGNSVAGIQTLSLRNFLLQQF